MCKFQLVNSALPDAMLRKTGVGNEQCKVLLSVGTNLILALPRALRESGIIDRGD